MQAFLVKIIFQIDIEDQTKGQFDVQYRCIHALDGEAARTKAETIAKNEEEAFLNHEEKKVCWRFLGITAVHPLSTVLDGGSVFAETHEAEDTAAYLRHTADHAVFAKAKYVSMEIA